jgi:hypothetical protein
MPQGRRTSERCLAEAFQDARAAGRAEACDLLPQPGERPRQVAQGNLRQAAARGFAPACGFERRARLVTIGGIQRHAIPQHAAIRPLHPHFLVEGLERGGGALPGDDEAGAAGIRQPFMPRRGRPHAAPRDPGQWSGAGRG